MAIAGWQAFVQDIAKALRDAVKSELMVANTAVNTTSTLPNFLHLTTKAIDHWDRQFELSLNRYSTPGKSETRDLLKWFGFDPTPDWRWSQTGGRGSSPFQVTSDHACDVLSQWLEVRHAVAHGHADFSRRGKGISGHRKMVVLSAVRDTNTLGPPGLRLRDAEACVRFLSALARLTADSAADHIGAPKPGWTPGAPRLVLGVKPTEL
nr:hypothetical protein [Actinoplanes consettensis]